MRNFNQWYLSLKWWQRGLYALGASSVLGVIWCVIDGEFIIAPLIAASIVAMLPLK